MVVQHDQILFVGPYSKAQSFVTDRNCRVTDLGQGALIPGLINAHTHLEFSDLAQPLGQAGIPFTDWIRLIVSQRRRSQQAAESAAPANSKSTAIARGIAESVASGVWGIGEIATQPWNLGDYQLGDESVALVCFLEQLGRDASLLNEKEQELDTFLNQTRNGRSDYPESIRLAASPHAPYSVGRGLLEQICRQSCRVSAPVAMHLAETLDERELIESGSGSFVSLLQDFDAWDPDTFQDCPSIAETIEILATAPRSLVVHGNYLNDSEIELIGSQNNPPSVVFCPRTHRYFGHADYPLDKLLNRNINVCLGTDSRASNPDLNLFAESQLVAELFPHVSPRTILAMSTENGAKAIGIESTLGSLAIGKRQAMSFVSNPNAGPDELPFDWLFDGQSSCSPVLSAADSTCR